MPSKTLDARLLDWLREKPEPEVHIELRDLVALLRPANGMTGDDHHVFLATGQIGQVIEAKGEAAVIVQFADQAGAVYAIASVEREKLLRLHYGDRGAQLPWAACPNAIPLAVLAGTEAAKPKVIDGPI